jgi:hypothetical protein
VISVIRLDVRVDNSIILTVEIMSDVTINETLVQSLPEQVPKVPGIVVISSRSIHGSLIII